MFINLVAYFGQLVPIDDIRVVDHETRYFNASRGAKGLLSIRWLDYDLERGLLSQEHQDFFDSFAVW